MYMYMYMYIYIYIYTYIYIYIEFRTFRTFHGMSVIYIYIYIYIEFRTFPLFSYVWALFIFIFNFVDNGALTVFVCMLSNANEARFAQRRTPLKPTSSHKPPVSGDLNSFNIYLYKNSGYVLAIVQLRDQAPSCSHEWKLHPVFQYNRIAGRLEVRNSGYLRN